MNWQERTKEDVRKIILFILGLSLIIITSFSSQDFLEIHNLQSFFQRLTGLIILALGMSFPFMAGLRDISGIGIYLLSLSLSERLRLTEWFSSQGSDFRLLVLSSLPFGFAIVTGLIGLLLARLEERILFFSTGALFFFGALAAYLKPAIGPACEAWFCGDSLLGVSSIFILVVPVVILTSIAAIRYYWPKFTWIGHVLVVWLGGLMLLFVTNEYQGIPLGAVLAVFSIFLVYAFTEHTRWGLGMTAWGSNREAARLSGVSPWQVYGAAYFGLGLFASLAGLMEFRSFEQANFYWAGDVGVLSWAALVIGGIAVKRHRSLINSLLAGVLFVACFEAFWMSKTYPHSLFFAALGLIVAVGSWVRR